jgi:hypothetical protein
MTATQTIDPLDRLSWRYKVILRGEVGSRVLGVSVDGTDDRDEMGICLEPPETVTGLDRFEHFIYRTQPDGVRSGPGDLDLVVYSLRKWMRLALKGNPSVLMVLFSPDPMVFEDEAREIRLEPERFVSKHAGYAFLNYLLSQRAQLTGERPKKHTNRPELVERYGFDTKFAYHAVRLGLQGAEFLTAGRLELPMAEPIRQRLLSLRQGGMTLAETLEWATEAEDALRRAIDATTADEPDRAWANHYLHRAYSSWWQQMPWFV